MSKSLLSCCLLGLVLSGCAASTEQAIIREGSLRLSADQVNTLVSDKTLHFEGQGFDVYMAYGSDGNFSAASSYTDDKNNGWWKVDEQGRLCQKFETWYHGDTQCFRAYKEADRNIFLLTDSSGVLAYTVTSTDLMPLNNKSSVTKQQPIPSRQAQPASRPAYRQTRSQEIAPAAAMPRPTGPTRYQGAANTAQNPTRPANAPIRSNAAVAQPKDMAQSCRGCNLQNKDLHGVNLANADLQSARLDNANLSQANLRQANLAGASLTRANLAGAKLPEADLRGADLRGADLTGANLYNADLTGARIQNTNFANTYLDGVKGLALRP